MIRRQPRTGLPSPEASTDLDPRMRRLTSSARPPKSGLRRVPVTVVHWLKTLAWQGAVPPQAAPFRWRKATIREQWEAHYAFSAGPDGTSQQIFAPVFAPFWRWDRSVSHSWRIERDLLHALTRKYVSKEPDVVTRRSQIASSRIRRHSGMCNKIVTDESPGL